MVNQGNVFSSVMMKGRRVGNAWVLASTHKFVVSRDAILDEAFLIMLQIILSILIAASEVFRLR